MGVLSRHSAIVTGAGSGFGSAIVRALADADLAVTLVGRTRTKLCAVAEEIVSAGGTAHVIEADVTLPDVPEQLVQETADKLGPLRLLVNNAAAAGPYGPIGAVDPERWCDAVGLHLLAPFRLMTAAIPQLREGGRIINIVSVAGTGLRPNLSAYAVGKAALINLSAHAAAELKGLGIAVFALHPGDAITDMARGTLGDPDAQRWTPGLVAKVSEKQRLDVDTDRVLAHCGAVCAALASGRLDHLSGRYLDAQADEALFDQPVQASSSRAIKGADAEQLAVTAEAQLRLGRAPPPPADLACSAVDLRRNPRIDPPRG